MVYIQSNWYILIANYVLFITERQVPVGVSFFEAHSAEHQQTKVASDLCERVIRCEATETEGLVYIYITMNI